MSTGRRVSRSTIGNWDATALIGVPYEAPVRDASARGPNC